MVVLLDDSDYLDALPANFYIPTYSWYWIPLAASATFTTFIIGFSVSTWSGRFTSWFSKL
jgi:hypothetical protein